MHQNLDFRDLVHKNRLISAPNCDFCRFGAQKRSNSCTKFYFLDFWCIFISKIVHQIWNFEEMVHRGQSRDWNSGFDLI